MDKIAAAQSKLAAPADAARSQPVREEIQDLSNFKPQFDEDDFNFEPEPTAETPTPGPSLPAYYRQPERETPVTYAGFWKRLAAALIDGLLFNFVARIVTFGISAVAGDMEFLLAVLEIVAQWLYFAVMESSYYQATYGKQIMGIKVTDMSGNRISFGRASGRYFAKFLSILSLGIGYLMIAFTPKKQGLHDMIAGCLVVNR